MNPKMLTFHLKDLEFEAWQVLEVTYLMYGEVMVKLRTTNTADEKGRFFCSPDEGLYLIRELALWRTQVGERNPDQGAYFKEAVANWTEKDIDF